MVTLTQEYIHSILVILTHIFEFTSAHNVVLLRCSVFFDYTFEGVKCIFKAILQREGKYERSTLVSKDQLVHFNCEVQYLSLENDMNNVTIIESLKNFFSGN